jgi:Asp-tRNA(Asn)/Glu-tRNA(Gln) amidotransferase A subunit family amidase
MTGDAGDALHGLSATGLAQAYARGELSPVEVLEAVLARIDACEPHLNAMYLVHRPSARLAARQSEHRWRARAPASPIDGVPVTLKENLYTEGDPAPIGCAANPVVVQRVDSPVAARVRQAGAVLIGKTTMPDLGMLSSGRSSMHGTTRNPWRLDLNPSGSSSGAGAAAAAGYGPLHVGTDIGGSIRLPANHCGVFGLKPSFGRVPIDPPFLGRVAGPMTRTVEDAALLMGVITQPDERDFMSLPDGLRDYVAHLSHGLLKGCRIGLLQEMGCGLAVQPAVRSNLLSAARALEQAGAIVQPIEPFVSATMLEGVQRFFEARSHLEVSQMSPEAAARMLPFVRTWCTWRAADFTGAQVMAAYNDVHAMRRAAVQAMAAHDFVLSPVSPVASYPALAESPGGDPRDALSHIAFTVAPNMSGQPAASVNWGFDDEGMPIGVQLIGRRFDDLGVLQLAWALERLRPAQRPWPELG